MTRYKTFVKNRTRQAEFSRATVETIATETFLICFQVQQGQQFPSVEQCSLPWNKGLSNVTRRMDLIALSSKHSYFPKMRPFAMQKVATQSRG